MSGNALFEEQIFSINYYFLQLMNLSIKTMCFIMNNKKIKKKYKIQQ